MSNINKLFLIVLLAGFTSCISSQKRLQRRIEKHGIKESISFVSNKYPEYFESKDTVIHDTIIKVDSVLIPDIDTTVILSDSSNFYHYKSDSLTLVINKLTGRAEIHVKTKTVYFHDTTYVEIPCPEIKCPEIKDYTKKKINFQWWWVVVGLLALGIFYIWTNAKNVEN
jgi:hypothetical protein